MLRPVAHLAVLAAVAAVGAAPPSTGVPDDEMDLDIAAAGRGLDRLVVATSDVAPAEVVACPLIDVGHVDTSFATAGVDAPLDDWLLEVRGTAGITCAGSHVGFEDDPSFPQLAVELTVVDAQTTDVQEPTGDALMVSDLPGGTTGACESDRFVTICEERWRQDGFEVRLLVTDRVFFDRVTASIVIGGLVPAVVANLAGDATDVADPLTGVSASEVGAASEGLDRFMSANAAAIESDDEHLDCPAIAAGEFQSALVAAGIDVDLDDWSASLTPVTFPDDLDPVPIRLTCTGGFDPQGRVDVIDFDDPAAADDFVASVGIADGGSAADLQPGDLTVGTCTSASGLRFCTEWWRDDGLVVGVWLVSDSQPIGDADAAAVLVEVLPTILANLADVDE